jgi:cytochrome P450
MPHDGLNMFRWMFWIILQNPNTVKKLLQQERREAMPRRHALSRKFRKVIT